MHHKTLYLDFNDSTCADTVMVYRFLFWGLLREVCVCVSVCVAPPYQLSHPNGAGVRTYIHLLLRPLLPLIVNRTHQTQAQEDFHRLQTKSQLRLADP